MTLLLILVLPMHSSKESMSLMDLVMIDNIDIYDISEDANTNLDHTVTKNC